jgi:hypothetical protein
MPEWTDVMHKCTYLAYSEETCPTTGKKHFQGFAYGDKMKLSGWKKLFPTAHIEKMKGNFEQNEKYCSKEGDLIEFGERPQQGKRNDILHYREALKTACPYQIFDENDQLAGLASRTAKFGFGYRDYLRKKELMSNHDFPQIYVRIGPPGSGKTRWVTDTYGATGYAIAPDNTGKWFDGCDRDVILFDDVENGQVPPFSVWKRLCDRYPFQVPYKGGFLLWKPKVIIFTSNYHPKEWWPGITEWDMAAFIRRIDESGGSIEVIE